MALALALVIDLVMVMVEIMKAKDLKINDVFMIVDGAADEYSQQNIYIKTDKCSSGWYIYIEGYLCDIAYSSGWLLNAYTEVVKIGEL